MPEAAHPRALNPGPKALKPQDFCERSYERPWELPGEECQNNCRLSSWRGHCIVWNYGMLLAAYGLQSNPVWDPDFRVQGLGCRVQDSGLGCGLKTLFFGYMRVKHGSGHWIVLKITEPCQECFSWHLSW